MKIPGLITGALLALIGFFVYKVGPGRIFGGLTYHDVGIGLMVVGVIVALVSLLAFHRVTSPTPVDREVTTQDSSGHVEKVSESVR